MSKEKIKVVIATQYEITIDTDHPLHEEFEDTRELVEHLTSYRMTNRSSCIEEGHVKIDDAQVIGSKHVTWEGHIYLGDLDE